MPSANIKKEISCSKEKLIEMVLDIEKYPEFVPWCINGKIYSKKDIGDKIEITADLTIGKSFLNQTYKSFVIYYKSSDIINVTNIDGPIKRLENKWLFKQVGKNSEIEGVIQRYELAYRMQTSAPQVQDTTEETETTRRLYGIDEAPTRDFGYQCLLARRFIEQGVRMVQVTHQNGAKTSP